MATNEVIKVLEDERTRLDKAIALLKGNNGAGTRRRRTIIPQFETRPTKRRTMSAATRKKIALAQQARWAKTRKSDKAEA